MSDDKIKRDQRARLRKEVKVKLEEVDKVRLEVREEIGEHRADKRLKELTEQLTAGFRLPLKDEADILWKSSTSHPQVSLAPAFEKMRETLAKRSKAHVDELRVELRTMGEALLRIADELGELELRDPPKKQPWYMRLVFWRAR